MLTSRYLRNYIYCSNAVLHLALATLSFSSSTCDSSEQKTQPTRGSFLLQTQDKASEAALIVKKNVGTNDVVGKQLIEERNKHLGPNVSVFYKQDGGLVVTKGEGAFMIDVDGNKHLDCCNNVAQVGHSHPKVVAAGRAELGRIQTNGRFLNPVQQRYIEKLLATFPPELNTVYLVNSGSEANDLALRIAREHGKKMNAGKPNDVIVLDHAYHGHTQALVNISPYKWYQATNGFDYRPSSTHVVPCPDTYRGKHRGATIDSSEKYAKYVEDIVVKTNGVGCFIAESVLGCGGQIVLPPGYLKLCYRAVRNCGGLCIADEVQTGFGRSGIVFWAFETQGVVPDIVTCGKPIANGYPMAAVVCRREVAESFASSGIEYFNTYGGNSVACSIAEAVIDIIHDEKLMENAFSTGQYITTRLLNLKLTHRSVGDVRGIGLFLGVEFVKQHQMDLGNITPNPELAKFIVDFMRYENVIVSRDGPDANVIKIKPPLVFNRQHADLLADSMQRALLAAENIEGLC